MSIAVRQGTRGQRKILSEVLGRAFYDDPVMTWFFPDDEGRRGVLPAWFSVVLRHIHRGPHDLALLDGTAAAAAIWDQPGQVKLGWWQTTLALPGLVRTMGKRAAVAGASADAMEKQRPEQPHWYLAILGTEPDLQGKGAGGALLRARLTTCDERGIGAYLESSKEANVPYYEKFGFTVTKEFPLPDGGPPVWLMWRDPR